MITRNIRCRKDLADKIDSLSPSELKAVCEYLEIDENFDLDELDFGEDSSGQDIRKILKLIQNAILEEAIEVLEEDEKYLGIDSNENLYEYIKSKVNFEESEDLDIDPRLDWAFKELEMIPTRDMKIIKRAYKKCALKYHPDRNPDISARKFVKVKEAYDLLVHNLDL